MSWFGIDFGTTNSSAVELKGGAEFKYGDAEDKPLPSIVRIDRATGAAEGGRGVWNDRLTLDRDGRYEVFPSIKELLEGDLERNFGEKNWTVPDLVAFVLGQISDRAKRMGVIDGIRQATFSIPVGCTPRARRVLREGAKRAGIKVNGFVKESTAALVRSDAVRRCRYAGVFDWGGGTLDVSIMEIRSGAVFELGIQGLKIAGNRIDAEIARLVHGKIMDARKTPQEFSEMPAPDQDHMTFQCERAKCDLSDNIESEVIMESYGGRPAHIRLTRAMCAPALEGIVEEAIARLDRAIQKAGLTPEQLEEIIMIGGSSKLWLLQERLETDERYARYDQLLWPKNPEWYVAHGAAILEASPGDHCLAETLALQLSDGDYFELARPGDRAAEKFRAVTVSLVEDAREANILIDHWNDHKSAPASVLRFTIPTLGFDLEPIHLSYRLTQDLTFEAQGRSTSSGSTVTEETGELRFSYDLGTHK